MSCTTCPRGSSRRRFLGRISGVMAATLIPGLSADVAALPWHEATGVAAGAGERRYPLPTADGVTIDRDAQVILVRQQQRIFAFALSCPHENTALRWRAADQRFQCPRHESKYRPDGTFVSGRATRHMDRLPIRRDGNGVLVEVDAAFQSDTQSAAWQSAVVVL